MASIYYSKNKDGTEVGRWNGKSIRSGGKVTKENQIYLGKVIDKEKLLFYKKSEGFYRFNPETLGMESIPDQDVPFSAPPMDRRLKQRNVIVSFGGSYFLHELINGIAYNKVLDCISLKNPDSMNALLHYYILTDKADCHALQWYQNSYVRFLYPRANLDGRRISDFYKSFGSDNNRRTFFQEHIPYLLKSTGEEFAVLLDSTGCQNSCRDPVTKVGRHNNKVNIEFRVVLVVQRSTGLPVYHEIIPGNIVDSSTIARIMRLMEMYGLKITHVSGDAACSCPANIEKVILCGSNLIMRLNPAYNLYAEAMAKHLDELTLSTYDEKHDLVYRNRVVRVIKVPMPIATDADGKEVTGFVYLCRDHQANHSKCDHYMEHHGSNAGSAEEIIRECGKYGVFAIVTTEELDDKDVIATYYLRQGIEQFFDDARNYGKMMPVRNHCLATISGHMLMSFIATFLVVAIRNRMHILDIPYVAVPPAIADKDKLLVIGEKEERVYIDQQEPVPSVFRSNPSALFFALNYIGADVFDKEKNGNNQIIPAVPMKDANDYFKAFGIHCPEAVLIGKDKSLTLVIKNGLVNRCKKSKVFATRPFVMQEEIQKKLEEEQKEKETDKSSGETDLSNKPEKPKRHPGRPKGSRNKKTLERETQESQAETPITPRRKRGRPLGSKDSKPRKRRSTNSLKEEEEKSTEEIPGSEGLTLP